MGNPRLGVFAHMKPCTKNSRKNEHAVDRMAETVKLYGYHVPVLVRATKVIGARSVGLTTEGLRNSCWI